MALVGLFEWTMLLSAKADQYLYLTAGRKGQQSTNADDQSSVCDRYAPGGGICQGFLDHDKSDGTTAWSSDH